MTPVKGRGLLIRGLGWLVWVQETSNGYGYGRGFPQPHI